MGMLANKKEKDDEFELAEKKMRSEITAPFSGSAIKVCNSCGSYAEECMCSTYTLAG